VKTRRGERAKRRHWLARQHGDIEKMRPWRGRGRCLPQIDWTAAGEKRQQECEHHTASISHDSALDHEETLPIIHPGQNYWRRAVPGPNDIIESSLIYVV
jgi:hypothetical protein